MVCADTLPPKPRSNGFFKDEDDLLLTNMVLERENNCVLKVNEVLFRFRYCL
jgi:hypothetical protein